MDAYVPSTHNLGLHLVVRCYDISPRSVMYHTVLPTTNRTLCASTLALYKWVRAMHRAVPYVLLPLHRTLCASILLALSP